MPAGHTGQSQGLPYKNKSSSGNHTAPGGNDNPDPGPAVPGSCRQPRHLQNGRNASVVFRSLWSLVALGISHGLVQPARALAQRPAGGNDTQELDAKVVLGRNVKIRGFGAGRDERPAVLLAQRETTVGPEAFLFAPVVCLTLTTAISSPGVGPEGRGGHGAGRVALRGSRLALYSQRRCCSWHSYVLYEPF